MAKRSISAFEIQANAEGAAVDEQDRVRSAQDSPARREASICLIAALRLRNLPRPPGRGVSLATSRLMEALGLELARDAASVPAAARRAALRLARELQASSPPPPAWFASTTRADPQLTRECLIFGVTDHGGQFVVEGTIR